MNTAPSFGTTNVSDAFWQDCRKHNEFLISPAKSRELEKWTAARDNLRKLHAEDAEKWPSFQGMASFVPKVFYRRVEMRNKNSCAMRAVLDYIMYLKNPNNTKDIIRRRQSNEPHKLKDIVKYLRRVIPAQSYAEVELVKEEVEENDVALVVVAARAYLLELTEGKPGKGLLGTTLAGVTLVTGDSFRSSEDSSLDAGGLKLMNLASRLDTTMGLDPVGLIPPFSPRFHVTTASELLTAFSNPPNPVDSPGRGMPVPIREKRNCRKRLSNSQPNSESRGLTPKKTKFKGAFEEENVPEVQDQSIDSQTSLPTSAACTVTSMDTILANFVEGGLRARKIVEDQNNVILRLNGTISAQDQEIVDFKKTVQKLKVDVACGREARMAVTEKSTRLQDEIAVLRNLAKAKGVTKEELNNELASITGI